MRRLVFSVLLSFFVLLVLSAKEAGAALVYVNGEGGVEVNVLSLESESGRGSLEVKEVSVGEDNPHQIALYNDNGNLSVTVANGADEKKLNVTDYKDAVVELEERPEVKNVTIEVENGKFAIREGEALAVTEYPITIDAKKGNLMIETGSGDRLIGVFPKEAIDGLLRAKTLTRQKNTIEIAEGDLGELMYRIPGEKVIDVFGFYEYPVEVTAQVSATTGEILSVDEPPWLRVVRIILQ